MKKPTKPTLYLREVTIELRDIDPDENIIEMGTTVNLLNNMGKALKEQLKNQVSWDKQLRIRAFLLCQECSAKKEAQVDVEATKTRKLARCAHLSEIKLPALGKK